jgi:hypothetical protein
MKAVRRGFRAQNVCTTARHFFIFSHLCGSVGSSSHFSPRGLSGATTPSDQIAPEHETAPQKFPQRAPEGVPSIQFDLRLNLTAWRANARAGRLHLGC